MRDFVRGNRLRLGLLGGAALLSVGVVAGAAQARPAADHVVTLALPGGGEASVAYAGAMPPRLVGFASGPLASAPLPMMAAFFGPNSPFAALDAEMQQESAALLRQAMALAEAPLPSPPGGALTPAALAAGPGMCLQSVSITYDGSGGAPRVVRREAGDCGAPSRPASPAAAPSYRPIEPARPAGTILVRSEAPAARVATPRLQEAAYWQPVRPPASR